MISFAFWATVINYLHKQALSVAEPVLREQFHMSNVEYSRVVFAFLLAYTVSNGVSGPLHRLACGPLFVHASVHRLRVATADLCDDPVAPHG
jgi:sugar phosphate permease